MIPKGWPFGGGGKLPLPNNIPSALSNLTSKLKLVVGGACQPDIMFIDLTPVRSMLSIANQPSAGGKIIMLFPLYLNVVNLFVFSFPVNDQLLLCRKTEWL